MNVYEVQLSSGQKLEIHAEGFSHDPNGFVDFWVKDWGTIKVATVKMTTVEYILKMQ